ncbi:DMT family transporter [Chromobacterium violaceum]|uniref:DMT family transporter n=1 Tax=Chromobacterium violaceum TaxID=536 RepID=UPI0005D39967|nr:SMR family transporter [Chromobacterium violaceum]KJH67339.1 multidrug transporter [Chromobacterium violaceum]KMN48465.1 multidrug transporter [Chromobacterium violaceum]KMN85633.1 multidrug transporter [Chromobacterium violaceum]KMN91538.1 multidrug transporter [Chromobacterium violaceum]KMO05722.1 multidrug transporter [Chromobacterium violaceum]
MYKKFFSPLIVAWLVLLAAIVCEIVGTSFMAVAARSGGYLGYVWMSLALALSYYLLSLALRAISVGVAYAVWEGLGLVGLTAVSVWLFGEKLVPQEIVGLGLALLGLVCVTMGETHDEEAAA